MPRRRNNPPPPKPLTDYPRKHCKNCPKYFYQTKPTKLFCSDTCRMQFHKFGNSFGALKETLEKLMRKEASPIVAKTFDAYVHGREFKRAMAAAGFIHKSQLTKRSKETRPAALLAAIRDLGGRLQNLNQRLTSIESLGPLRAFMVSARPTSSTAADPKAAPEEVQHTTESTPAPETPPQPTEHSASNSKALASLKVFRAAAKRAGLDPGPPLCDACDRGLKVPKRYHGLDCPKRK